VIFEIDALFRLVRAEQICVLVLIASGDELLQFQFLEVVGEVVEEIADARVIAVAENGLPFEVLRIVPEFLLDV